MKPLKYLALGLIAVSLAACGDTGISDASSSADTAKTESASRETLTEKQSPTASRRAENHAAIMAAIQSPDRIEAEKADDEIRKVADVLSFAGITPGMTVLELEAGAGYYTELLSRIVGSKGKIFYQNPASFDGFITPEEVVARFGEDGNRLPNVDRYKSTFDDLSFASDSSVDMVTWFLGPHELWLPNEKGLLTLGDPDKTYAEIFRVLKPGGSFVALDHKTSSGTPEASGGDTHRIDPDLVRARAEAAGLTFSRESNILANPEDDYDVMVFNPSVRRKTDRFLHIYVKPE